MKGHKMKFKPLKYLCVAVFLVIACVATRTYATEGEEETTNTNLPYIEMKVNSVKVGETNQILVECWASNLTNLEAIDMAFTYDNTKLIPSKVSDNTELENLASIKYENMPTNDDAREAFRTLSTNILSNSFVFDTAYENILDMHIFEYLASDGNNETLRMVLSRESESSLDALEPVLLGRFSFKQAENTVISENAFNTKKIQIICNDWEEFYSRIEQDGEDCTEIMEFTYAQYGSISGTIEARFFTSNVNTRNSKNIATVNLYRDEDVSNVDWDATQGYESIRNNLPAPMISYTTVENDNGQFDLDKIPFGNYVIMIDKNMYADYIIKDIVIDSKNNNIDLNDSIGSIELILGDVDKDGAVKGVDRLKVNNAYKIFDSAFDIDDSAKMDGVDKVGFNMAYKLYANKVIKTVISLEELESVE